MEKLRSKTVIISLREVTFPLTHHANLAVFRPNAAVPDALTIEECTKLALKKVKWLVRNDPWKYGNVWIDELWHPAVDTD